MSAADLDALRDKIQREIEVLERSLGPDISSIDVVLSGSNDGSENDDSDSREALDEDLEADEIALGDAGHRAEMCLQMNLVYQAVIQEKLQELELLISQNKVQQEELLWELAGRRTQSVSSKKLYPANLSVGHFFKPYFKDKATGLGPPANPEMMERSSHVLKTFKELSCKKWRTADSEELRAAILSDGLQKLVQPKLLKLEYLQQKLRSAQSDTDKNLLRKQIQELERDMHDIHQLPNEQLLGQRTDEHDWEKISNVNFEGNHSAGRLSKIWKNQLHPHVNAEPWTEEEIKKLQEIAIEHNFENWESIAEALGTNRTAFQCLQQHQFNNKDFRRKGFTKEEDEMLMYFVQRMRVGMHIPYRKIAYFMEGRDSMQLLHRWSKCLDPTVKKGPWSIEEDERLLKAVEKYGEKDWYKIRYEVPGRTDIQCRERYYKGLHKDIKKGKWTPEEEQKLVELTKKYGVGHWTKVGREITHRTGSQCLSKWKLMMGYFKERKKKYKMNITPQKRSPTSAQRKRPRRAKPDSTVPKIKEEGLSDEDVSDASSERSSSSSSFMSSSSSSSTNSSSSSEDEDDMEDDSDVEERRAATKFLESLPDLDLWIPRKSKKTIFRSYFSTSGRVPRTKMRGKRGHFQFNTILKGIAYPPSTDIVTESPEDILKEFQKNGYQILEITEDDVRRLLRCNTLLCQGKQGQQLEQLQTESEGDTSERLRPRRSRRRIPVERNLLVAVTPWVGNIFLPLPTQYKTPWDKQILADAMRKKLASVKITSTPMFTLLIQLFQINAEGCLQMIKLRKTQQSESLKKSKRRNEVVTHSNAGPRPQSRRGSAHSPVRNVAPAPKLKTVYELLQEKRMAQFKARRSAQNDVPSPSLLVSPQIVVNTDSTPSGPHQDTALPISSPAPQNVLLPTSPFVPLPTCQVIGTSNMASNQISSASGNSTNGQGADAGVATAVGQNVQANNLCNGTPSIGSPCTAQAMPGSQVMASPQMPIQLLQSVVSPVVTSTTWVLTPQGLVQIPLQALFPSLSPMLVNQNLSVSEPSSIMSTDSSSNGTSTNKGPEMPTSSTSTEVQQLPASSGSSSPENTAGEAAQIHHVQPTNSLSPEPLPTLSPPNKAMQFSQTPKKYPVVKIAKVCPSTQQVANSQTPTSSKTTTQIPTGSTDKNIVDLSLISLEAEASVKDWLQGKSGGGTLKNNMAYLPPSACNLKTFSRILLEKKTLEEGAFRLLPHSEEEEGGERDIRRKREILDELVEQKLKDNPAYNILKQRFLSAFMFPGLLAAFTPPNSTAAKSVVKSEVKDEDNIVHIDEHERHDNIPSDGHTVDNATGQSTPSHPDEGETLNPDSQWTPMDVECVAGNTRSSLRRRMLHRRSET
ncbi:snRNA-activating protein complex subunit 4 [Leptodactylus fuscus]|uniref:snRNA-activating protein complex subunit 4 n=1 Tax=Leptodactylus fuscus TaxID=238119 RepID=UPI003F4F3657